MEYITGANGFIGKHLIKRLSNPTAIPHRDITSTTLELFDQFFFLSTYGNMHYQQEDDLIIKANVTDLISVLDQIDFQATKPFKSFVYLSSSSVKLRRQTMYSRAKKAAEEILLSYAEKYNAPICIIRPFSVTGKGEQPEHLIPTLIRSCMTGERIDFVPNPVHDFIDVEDVVDGIINLAHHGAKGVFELGSGTGTTNQAVLELVEKTTKKKANVNIVASMRDYDNQEWVSNNFRARMYGWLNQTNLERSIEEQVEAYEREN